MTLPNLPKISRAWLMISVQSNQLSSMRSPRREYPGQLFLARLLRLSILIKTAGCCRDSCYE